MTDHSPFGTPQHKVEAFWLAWQELAEYCRNNPSVLAKVIDAATQREFDRIKQSGWMVNPTRK